jgi:hypothetical protein
MRDVPKVLQELEIDPYEQSGELLALRVRELAPQHEREFHGLQRHGEEIWRMARIALLWWTPARTEQEALKRAADDPAPSTIAREVALFTALYEQFAVLSLEMFRSSGLSVEVREALRFQMDLLRSTLEALERRAQSAEARATDYRLRYEFDKLRQVVAGRELGSKVAELLERASQNTESIEHLRALVAEAQPTIQRMGRDLAVVRGGVDYAVDRVVEEAARRMLPAERLKSTVAVLADFAGAGSILWEVLQGFARHLG